MTHDDELKSDEVEKVIQDIDPDNPPITDFSHFITAEAYWRKKLAPWLRKQQKAHMRQVRHSEQPYESDWLTWDHGTPIAQQIEQFLVDKYWVYDADVCGTDTHQFVVQQAGECTFWQAEHAWWIQYDPEWSCENEFDIQQVESVQFTYPVRNRDWLKLTQR